MPVEMAIGENIIVLRCFFKFNIYDKKGKFIKKFTIPGLNAYNSSIELLRDSLLIVGGNSSADPFERLPSLIHHYRLYPEIEHEKSYFRLSSNIVKNKDFSYVGAKFYLSKASDELFAYQVYNYKLSKYNIPSGDLKNEIKLDEANFKTIKDKRPEKTLSKEEEEEFQSKWSKLWKIAPLNESFLVAYSSLPKNTKGFESLMEVMNINTGEVVYNQAFNKLELFLGAQNNTIYTAKLSKGENKMSVTAYAFKNI